MELDIELDMELDVELDMELDMELEMELDVELGVSDSEEVSVIKVGLKNSVDSHHMKWPLVAE